MKTKVTYTEVKAALASGFVSPLNSKALKPAIALVRTIISFRNADKPREAAAHIDQLIKDSGALPFWKAKAPKTAAKQNTFIAIAIREARAQS